MHDNVFFTNNEKVPLTSLNCFSSDFIFHLFRITSEPLSQYCIAPNEFYQNYYIFSAPHTSFASIGYLFHSFVNKRDV